MSFLATLLMLLYGIVGTTDPSSVAVDAKKNSLYFKTDSPVGIFIKTDNGLSTNWTKLNVPSPATGVAYQVAFYDGAGNLSSDTGVAPQSITYNPNTGFFGVGVTSGNSLSQLQIGNCATSGGADASSIILGQCDAATSVGGGSILAGGFPSSNENSVAGANSFVIGGNNDVNGDNNIVGGATNFIESATSLAVGSSNTLNTSSQRSIIYGNGNTGNSDSSILGGTGSSATSACTNSIVIGDSASCTASNGVAIGSHARVTHVHAMTLTDSQSTTTNSDVANRMKLRFENGLRLIDGHGLGTGASYELIQSEVDTTDNTPAVVQSFGTPDEISDGLSALIEARVIAIRTGGIAGVPGDSATYIVRARCKNLAGVFTVYNVTQDYVSEDNANLDATIVTSGTSCDVQVTGDTNNDYTWEVTSQFQVFGG